MRVGSGVSFCYLQGMKPGENLFLIGPRASGKTSVGRILSSSLGLGMKDTDEIVSAKIGSSIADFVDKHGWKAFRRLERLALAEAAEQGGSIIATGGGIVLDEANVALLKSAGPVFYLKADPDTLAGRLIEDPNDEQRPSLTGGDLAGEVAQVLAEREPLYMGCADHVVMSAGGPESAAEEIMRLIKEQGE